MCVGYILNWVVRSNIDVREYKMCVEMAEEWTEGGMRG